MNLTCPDCKKSLIEDRDIIYCSNELCNSKCIYYVFLDGKNLLIFEHNQYDIRYNFSNNKITFDGFKKLSHNEIFFKPIKETESDVQYFFDTAYNIYKKYEENLLFL